MENEKEKSLENLFSDIEEVITELTNPEISIEDAFSKYEKGIQMLKDCNDKLDLIEKKVLALGEDGELHEF